MKRKVMSRILSKATIVALAVFGFASVESCVGDDHPGTYYTFTGETVAHWLENRTDDFGTFIDLLKKANLWGEMRTYGEYTCFIPDDEAFEEYFKNDLGVSGVDELSPEKCDSIVRTHIMQATMYCVDLVEGGALPYPNMLDRYLSYTCDSDSVTGRPIFLINQQSAIIARDDTVENGVIHIVNKVVTPSNNFLAELMGEDPKISIFSEALQITGMADSIAGYLDQTYPTPDYDSLIINKDHIYKTVYETDYIVWPEKRYFKYTAFVETDDVFKKAGINSIDDLVAYVTPIYEASFPDAIYDKDDYTDRNHPLNRFVSYHLLPEQLFYDQLTISEPDLIANHKEAVWKELDIEEFYETMMPHSIMRISYPQSPAERFINRKGGTKRSGLPSYYAGVKILKETGTGQSHSALNGVYHYIDKVLVYDKTTREEILNTRMRIMCQTLSPDIQNSGARGRLGDANSKVYGYKKGFIKNFKISDGTEFYARYRNKSFSCYNGEEITVTGSYDVEFKLPPVPTDGTYEIRFLYWSMKDRGIVQFYLNGEPCNIPLNMSLGQQDPNVGYVKDSSYDNEEDPAAMIAANDKNMHNRGYMKGPDSYYPGADDDALRTQNDGDNGSLRRILYTGYLRAEDDNWMRLRLVSDNPQSIMPFNAIEIVPKSIYAGDTPEDKH